MQITRPPSLDLLGVRGQEGEIGRWLKSTRFLFSLKLTRRHRKMLMIAKEEGGRDKLGVWDSHIHTAIYKYR